MNSVQSPSIRNMSGCFPFSFPCSQKSQKKSILVLLMLTLILIAAVLFALKAGSYETPVSELVKGIFGASSDQKINLVIQNNRLPRILTAVLAGAGLGLSGCVFQAILQNPLASASTLGVSQGASFGAAAAIILAGFGSNMRIGISLCAFAGSIAVALVILGLSKFRRISPQGIVLSGVAISSIFTGATTLIQYFADEVQLAALVYWTFGDLGSTSWADLKGMGIIFLVLLAYCFFHRWDYNALLSGEETAKSLGIHVSKLILANMLMCCLASSFIVANVGLISFVGLVAPHILRIAIGNNYVYLIPGSALAGAALLLLSDLFARTVISPVILPIGAITSFLGGPLFLYLLFKDGGRA